MVLVDGRPGAGELRGDLSVALKLLVDSIREQSTIFRETVILLERLEYLATGRLG